MIGKVCQFTPVCFGTCEPLWKTSGSLFPIKGVLGLWIGIYGLWNLAGWTLLERGLRISMVGLGVWLLSKLLHPWLRRFYGVYLIIVAVLFTAALSAVIAAWS